MGELTAPNLISLGVALLALIGVIYTARVARANMTRQLAAQEHIATGDLHVKANLAEIEAARLVLTDRQMQAEREGMIAEITAHMGELYNRMLVDANAELDRKDARITALEAGQAVLQAGLAECERRDAENVARLVRIERLAERNGWSLT